MRSRQRTWAPPAGRRWTRADAEEMIVELAAAGGAIAPFAREHGINAQRVRWWRDRVAVREAPAVRFAPVRIVANAPHVADAGGSAHGTDAIEIAVGEVVVRVREGFDDSMLRRVLAALRSRP